MKRLIGLIMLLPLFVLAQDDAEVDAWKDFRYFEGDWQGEVSGMSGTGNGERHYEFILGDNYLHFKNKAVFEPQEKNPKGEVHEDWGFFSFDRSREKVTLRQFHIEGFVNQYVVDSVSGDGKTIIMTTESVENAPKGMRARYIFKIAGDNEFTEVFELAFPGKDFAACNETDWVRKK